MRGPRYILESNSNKLDQINSRLRTRIHIQSKFYSLQKWIIPRKAARSMQSFALLKNPRGREQLQLNPRR